MELLRSISSNANLIARRLFFIIKVFSKRVSCVTMGKTRSSDKTFMESILNAAVTGYHFPQKPIKSTINTQGAIIMDEQKKRTRRTPEQLAEEVDGKIQKLDEELAALAAKRDAANAEFDKKETAIKERIAALVQRKKDILAPKPPRKPRKTKKQKIQELIRSASKAGLKPEEIAQRLGLDQPEE